MTKRVASLGWLSIALLSACAPRMSSGDLAATPADPAADTALFAVVVRALAAKAQAPFRVDPRPLDPNFEFLGASLAESNDAALAARREVLRRLGIAETDAFANDRCPGILVPDHPSIDRSACPKDGRIEGAILAVPRRPQPGDSAATRTAQTAIESWIVRVSNMTLDPRAGSTVIQVYVVGRDCVSCPWRVLGMQNVGFIE